jgi:hypothetical protein
MCAVNKMKRKRDSSMPTATRVAKMMRSPSKQITSNDFLLSVEKAKVVRGNILKDDFFHQHSASEMEAYGMEVTRAIRSRDFEKVKDKYSNAVTDLEKVYYIWLADTVV